MNLEVVVLAAGQGTRMKSRMPKVLHPLAGTPMVGHVVRTAKALDPKRVHVVIGHGAAQVEAYLKSQSVELAEQTEQLGTGHAVAQALPKVDAESIVLVLYGDVPLIETGTLQALLEKTRAGALGLLTVELDDPTGYGRIVRDGEGQVQAIVEHKDASDAQRLIREINTGILALPAAWLQEWLPELSSDNAQGEYYLTDIIAMAAASGRPIAAVQPGSVQEVEGVNSRQQLAALERCYQRSRAEALMVGGVTLMDPARLDIRGNAQVAQDVTLDVNVILEGEVVIEEGVSVGANCILKNCHIKAGAVIKPNSLVEDAVVGEGCEVGPFARLRPGTEMAAGSKVGNFVETKKAIIGEGSKVNHLTYIGDAEIGREVNIGAGTITCNYDGVNKSKTLIGDGAFIGSNSSLVAPVQIGAGATVGAGSTISKPVGADQLAVARGKQVNLDGWQRPKKQDK